jgi:MFS family permease
MDQGPMVNAGVPALGFAAGYPPEFSDLHYNLWHSPEDSMEHQSAEALGGSGLVAEALIRQLLSMESFPDESGPYLYFDNSKQVLRGLPLYLIFIVFVGLFFASSYFTGSVSIGEKVSQWPGALAHYLGLWLPLVATIPLMLYLFVELGILVEYHAYPATTKDPEMLNPDWLAVFLFIFGLAVTLFIGRISASRYLGRHEAVEFGTIKSLAFLIIGIVGVYILFTNPFSLLFLVPVLFWLLITGKSGAWKTLDIFFFLLGGLLVYALVYFFGFVILRYGIVFLWMFLNMFATGTISFGAALAGTAVLAAGLSMLVKPPQEIKQ